jgi:hypothetical protein
MLYAGTDGNYEILSVPDSANVVLSFKNGKPEWTEPDELAAKTGFLRFIKGSYVGDAKARTIDLGVTPKLFWYGTGTTFDTAWLDGHTSSGGYTVSKPNNADMIRTYNAFIQLSGNKLKTWNDASEMYTQWGANCRHYNEPGVVYNWTAIY